MSSGGMVKIRCIPLQFRQPACFTRLQHSSGSNRRRDRLNSNRFCKMRTILGALLVSAVCISTAAAEEVSWSMDHGHSADAANASKAAADAAKARAAAIAAGTPLKPSQTTDFSVNGRGVVRAARLTPEEEKAEADGRAAWLARCRPTTVEDREGLRRTQYAEPDCALSRFNTAGAP
jgi:hypothetical protein